MTAPISSPITGMRRSDAGPGDLAFALLQCVLPTRLLCRLVHLAARSRRPAFKNLLIRAFLARFDVDLEEAEHARPQDYESFNAFFTRALKAGRRPPDADAQALVSPCDGMISQWGTVREGRIVQAKGRDYTAAELLGGEDLAAPFGGGGFCTLYLAPNNYHRLHMPLDGVLREWVYLPGRLFSVNPATARAMPRLFARNERVAALFDTARGPLAMVLVGALFVGSIETVWAGQITPPHRRCGARRQRPAGRVALRRGDEMGRFNMGSTVILLTPAGVYRWADSLYWRKPLRVGELLAKTT